MVGQSEYVLIAWRIAGSARTSIAWTATSYCDSTATTAAEKPPCGRASVPFMNNPTGCAVMVSAIPTWAPSLFVAGAIGIAAEQTGSCDHECT